MFVSYACSRSHEYTPRKKLHTKPITYIWPCSNEISSTSITSNIYAEKMKTFLFVQLFCHDSILKTSQNSTQLALLYRFLFLFCSIRMTCWPIAATDSIPSNYQFWTYILGNYLCNPSNFDNSPLEWASNFFFFSCVAQQFNFIESMNKLGLFVRIVCSMICSSMNPLMNDN